MTANAPAPVSRLLRRSLTLWVGAAERLRLHVVRKFEYDRLPLNGSSRSRVCGEAFDNQIKHDDDGSSVFLMEAGHSRRLEFSIPNQSRPASLLKKRK